MRKFIPLLLTVCAFSLTANAADLAPSAIDSGDIESGDYSQLESTAPSDGGTSRGISLTIGGDVISKTKIKDGYFKDDEFRYSEGHINASKVVYYNECYKEGLSVGLTHTSIDLKWDDNPWFDQQRFNIFSVTVGGFSERLHRWFWQGSVVVNVDEQHWDLCEYGFYDLLLWGRYEFNKCVGVHIGLLAQTGMKMDRVYPILGADWQISKNWKLNAVFPVNMSLEYTWTKHWTFAIAARNFDSRDRASKKETRAVWHYQNVGTELAVKYATKYFTAKIHGGSTIGGKLRIADRNNKHPRTYKFNPSMYAGAEVALTF